MNNQVLNFQNLKSLALCLTRFSGMELLVVELVINVLAL